MFIRSPKTLKIAAAAAALAIGGAAIPATVTPAEAKKLVFVKKFPHHGPHFGRYIGAGLLVAGAYAGSQSCYWLKVRAMNTGSSYWWDRYHDCIAD